MNLRHMICTFCAGFLLLGGRADADADVAEQTAGLSTETPVVVRISKQLFDDLLKDAVVDRTAINRFALGARSVGVAESSAHFHITLKPLEEQARFLIEVTGQSRTSTVAHSRSVRIAAGSHTDFEGQALVHYDGLEFQVPDGEVTASSRMWFGQVTTSRRGLVGRLVRRIALRLANRNKPQALQLLRENTEAAVAERFDQALDELETELQQVTPLEQTVMLLFPETRSWVYQLSTTTDYLQSGVGPQGAVVPELPSRGDGPMQAAIELWVRLPADDPRLDRLALLWNGAQRVLNGLPPEGATIDSVQAVRVGAWWVIDLHTASTQPGNTLADKRQPGQASSR